MNRKLSIEVPEEATEYWDSEKKLTDTLSVLSVIELVRSKKISTGKAAEILRISRWELMELLSSYDVPIANFPEDELNRQITDDKS